MKVCDILVFKVLTNYVVVFPFEELQTPKVRAKLLELKSELDILVWFNTVQERRVGLRDCARVQLLTGNHVQLVILNSIHWCTLHSWTYNVHFVPDLRIQH